MPNKRNIDLTKYGISKYRYAELKNYCLQYPEWRDKLKYENSALKGQQLTGMPFVSGISDTTYLLAAKRMETEKNRQIIEQTLIEAITTIKDGNSRYLFPGGFSCLYDHMIQAVTDEDISYTYLDQVKHIPISRSAFYQLKRYFFCLLDQNKK